MARGPSPERLFAGDPHKAAAAVLRVANANMESALRRVSVERGHDPRDFTLVAFGGAGPLHACDLAAALRIPRVLVPPYPGVLSALGMATAPVIKDLSASTLQRIDAPNVADGFSLPQDPNVADGFSLPPGGGAGAHERLSTVHADLESRGRAELESEGFPLDGLAVQTVLDMRYAGQSYELPVTTDSLDPAAFVPHFHQAHQARYGHSDPSRPVEVVNLRLKLVLPAPATTPRPARPEALVGQAEHKRTASAPLTHRDVWFDGATARTAVYDRAALTPGAKLRGPTVITQMDSTTVIPPGWQATVDGWSNLVLEPD